MKLFITAKEFNGRTNFSATITNGNKGEEKVTAYLDVQFAKCTAPSGEKNLISVSADDCFFSCFKSKIGNKIKLIIFKYKVEQNYDENQSNPQANKSINDLSPTEEVEGLPF